MTLTKAQRILLSSSLSVFLAGCGSPNYSQSESHITVEEVDSQQHVKADNIPPLVRTTPSTPAFTSEKHTDTYDVVVVSVPVRDLLFALARDSGINMDIDDRVGGLVTISALDQTLDAILERIKHQVDIRVEVIGDAILIKRDEPYHKHYTVDFLNIERTYTSEATTSGVGDGEASITNTASNTFWQGLEEGIQLLLDTSEHAPGESGIVATQGEGDGRDILEAIDEAESRNISGKSAFVLNKDTGAMVVYAPERIQKEVGAFLDKVLSIAKRQVLLEATVVEVVLNNQYNQGIDWSLFNSLAEEGLGLYQGATAGGAAAALQYIAKEFDQEFTQTGYTTRAEAQAAVNGFLRGATSDALNEVDESEFTITPREIPEVVNEVGTVTTPASTVYDATAEYTVERVNQTATRLGSGGLSAANSDNGFFTAAYRKGDLSAAVQLLDTFGDAKVLSSPRISALNHQPAILRVVDQEVYFNIEVEEDINEETGRVTSREVTVEENTVDIGFAMNVFPQISGDGEVILNIKPSVTRVLGYREVPVFNSVGGERETNRVPITRVRELDSVLSLRDGEVAVMGGLLEDRTSDNNSSVPGLSSLPGVGVLFEKKNESTFKTEFVVFIRARIIKNPSINGDYSDFRHLLPNSDFIIRDTEGTFLPPKQRKSR